MTGSKNIFSCIYKPSVIRAGSEWTTGYDAELSLAATVVEANAINIWSSLTFITPSEAVTCPLATATGFFFSSVEPKFYVLEPSTIVSASTTAVTNGKSSNAAATTTATAAAATTTTTTIIVASAATAAVSKDVRTCRPENSQFDRITARCNCIWCNHTWGKFEPRN